MDVSEIKKKFPAYADVDDQVLADAINEQYNDPSEIELIWEGMKAGIPEMYHGAKQFAVRGADKIDKSLPDKILGYQRPKMNIAPETIRQADADANQYGQGNPYDLIGEDPEKKSFDTFNPYRTGKTMIQMGLPISPSKVTMAKRGLEGLKARAKFGGKTGAGYGVALPTQESDGDYWAKKGMDVATSAGGGIVGGELLNSLIKGGAAGLQTVQTYGGKGVNLIKNLVQKIQSGDQLPQTLKELGERSQLREVSSELQARIQGILDKANEQGGVISPDEAMKIARWEDIGYPLGSRGAAKYPHEPLSPAQVTRDPYIAQEEIMASGHPAMKQKAQEQANYMTGAVEKISEKLQGSPYTGEAGYPSARETGELVADVANKMKDRLRGKTEKIYSEATSQYGKNRVKPTGFLKTVKQLEPDATAADVIQIAKGYEAMVRSAMQNQTRPYRGQRGTMKKDMWASGYGNEKTIPPPKADSLNVASLEGIRKKLTRQSDQLKRQGNFEGAEVLRTLRKSIDADVERAVGHDVYKSGRTAHQLGMQKLEVPVVNKVLIGKYDDDFAKIVDDVKSMSYEKLLKLKQGMVTEGEKGKNAWKRLSAQIWHDMKEEGIRGAEGHGKGRITNISTIEQQLKKFGKSARGLGANSEKGKLLFGEDVANEINNIVKLSRDLDILGVGEVKTGWGAALNILDWGSKMLGKVPSLGARGGASVMQGTRRAIGGASKDKQIDKIAERTMGGPIFSGMRNKKKAGYPSRYMSGAGARLGAIEGQKRKRGILSP